MATMTITPAPPDAKTVALTAEGGATVMGYLDEQVPVVDAESYTGWQKQPIPGRRGRPVWQGLPCPSVTFGIILDGWLGGPALSAGLQKPQPVGPLILTAVQPSATAGRRSVELEKRALEVMAGAFVAGDPEPPLLTVTAPRVPHDSLKARQNRWVLGALTWGDAITREGDGAALRQQVTLTLFLWTADDLLERVTAKQPKPTYQVEIAKTGDTYNSIAVRKFGTQRLGRKLAELNGDRDPTKTLRRGQKVRMPSAHTLAGWKRDLRGSSGGN